MVKQILYCLSRTISDIPVITNDKELLFNLSVTVSGKPLITAIIPSARTYNMTAACCYSDTLYTLAIFNSNATAIYGLAAQTLSYLDSARLGMHH